MKKSLLLVSLLAAFGTASAASSVTLYGTLDGSIGQTKTTTVTAAGLKTVEKNSSLVREGNKNGLSGSRFGIKGSEDLGMGLKGHFVLEQAADVSSGEFNSSNRQTYVGLSGDFGTLTLGRQYTPFYDAVEPLINVDAGGSFIVSNATTKRADSSIKYTSPMFSGVQASVLAGSDKKSVTGFPETKDDVMGASLSYTHGKMSAALGYHGVESKSGSISNMKTETSSLGLGYNFGVAKVIASYTEQKETGAGFMGNITNKDATIGVKVPFGAAYVMASVGQNEMKNTLSSGGSLWKSVADGKTTATGATNTANMTVNASSKGTNAVLGLGYHLSKRTEAYARYAKMNEAKYKTVAGVANGSTKSDAFSVGVRHTF
jgi:general bacterial porin, GBP family